MNIDHLAQNIYAISSDPRPTPGIWSETLYCGGLPKYLLEMVYSILNALGWETFRAERLLLIAQKTDQSFHQCIDSPGFNKWLYPVLKQKVWPDLNQFIARFQKLTDKNLTVFFERTYLPIKQRRAAQKIARITFPTTCFKKLCEEKLSKKETFTLELWIEKQKNRSIRQVHKELKSVCILEGIKLQKLEQKLRDQFEMLLFDQADPIYLNWTKQQRLEHVRFGINEATLGIECERAMHEHEKIAEAPKPIEIIEFHPRYLIQKPLKVSLSNYPWIAKDKLSNDYEIAIAESVSKMTVTMMDMKYVPVNLSAKTVWVGGEEEPFLRTKIPCSRDPYFYPTLERFLHEIGNQALFSYVVQKKNFQQDYSYSLLRSDVLDKLGYSGEGLETHYLEDPDGDEISNYRAELLAQIEKLTNKKEVGESYKNNLYSAFLAPP